MTKQNKLKKVVQTEADAKVSEKRKPWFYSITLHICVFAIILTQVPTHSHSYTPKKSMEKPIIDASTIDERKIEMQISHIQTQEKRAIESRETKLHEYERKMQLAEEKAKRAARWRRVEQRKAAKIRAQQRADMRKRQQLEKEQKILKQELAKTKKLRQTEAQKLETIRRKQRLAQLQKQLAEEQKEQKKKIQNSGALRGQLDKYRGRIIQTISHHWIVPHDVNPNLSARLFIHLAPGGRVLSVKVVRSSGNRYLDKSARLAVLKSSPLPVPKDKKMFASFRDIYVSIRPESTLN